MFRRRSSGLFTPPSGLNTTKRVLGRSVPFVYDANGTSAAPLPDMFRKPDSPHVSLVKGYDAADKALQLAELKGMRADVIVLLDGSGSMRYDYSDGTVQLLLARTLGFAMQLDADGQIPVIVYGSNVQKPVVIKRDNYLDAGSLVRPDYSYTNMGGALREALRLAAGNSLPTLIFNLTDGNPLTNAGEQAAKVDMSNATVDSASGPYWLKNLAIRPVPYLEEIDDLPSQYEIEKNPDGSAVRDANDDLVMYENADGIRLLDNVDSKAIDPHTISPEKFATEAADELGTWLEASGRVGTITGVPGVYQTF